MKIYISGLITNNEEKGLNRYTINSRIERFNRFEKIIKEHDNHKGFIEEKSDQIAVIPGCEVTTFNWHLVIFGMKNYEILQKYFSNKGGKTYDPFKLSNILSFTRSKGLWTVVAHPLLTKGVHGMSMKRLVKHADDLDAMEIGNGEFRRILPETIYNFWTATAEKTASDLGLRPLTGSDAHRSTGIGMCSEILIKRNPENTVQDISSTIMNGHIITTLFIPK